MPPTPRHDGWTPARRERFLEGLGRGHSVKDAAAAVGMSARGAYRLRARAGEEEFARQWDVAVATPEEVLLPDLIAQALNGKTQRYWYGRRLLKEEPVLDTRLALQILRAVAGRRKPPRNPV